MVPANVAAVPRRMLLPPSVDTHPPGPSGLHFCPSWRQNYKPGKTLPEPWISGWSSRIPVVDNSKRRPSLLPGFRLPRTDRVHSPWGGAGVVPVASPRNEKRNRFGPLGLADRLRLSITGLRRGARTSIGSRRRQRGLIPKNPIRMSVLDAAVAVF